MAVWAGPEPKDARTSGAQPVARLLPNMLSTAGVSTTTAAERNGSPDAGPTTSSSCAGNPRAVSAAHVTRSQATLVSWLTCWVSHVIVAARTVASSRCWAAVGCLAAGGLNSRTATTATTPAMSPASTANASQVPRRRLGRRRFGFFAAPGGADAGGPAWAGAVCLALAGPAPLSSLEVTESGLICWVSSSSSSKKRPGPALATGSGLAACPRFPLIPLGGFCFGGFCFGGFVSSGVSGAPASGGPASGAPASGAPASGQTGRIVRRRRQLACVAAARRTVPTAKSPTWQARPGSHLALVVAAPCHVLRLPSGQPPERCTHRAMRTARYSGAHHRRVFKRHCELLQEVRVFAWKPSVFALRRRAAAWCFCQKISRIHLLRGKPQVTV